VIAAIPAHPFEPAKRVFADTAVQDIHCGYAHRINDALGIFCWAAEAAPVHHGADMTVRVTEEESND
jgi:hypothetical protein